MALANEIYDVLFCREESEPIDDIHERIMLRCHEPIRGYRRSGINGGLTDVSQSILHRDRRNHDADESDNAIDYLARAFRSSPLAGREDATMPDTSIKPANM